MKYDNSIFKFHPQNTLNQAFLILNLIIFTFKSNFTITQIWGHWIRIWQKCSSNSWLKIPKCGIFQILRLFSFAWNFGFWQFETVDFKYDNSIFKFQPKISKIRHFWSQIYGFLLLQQILQLGKFESTDFKYDNSFLKIS